MRANEKGRPREPPAYCFPNRNGAISHRMKCPFCEHDIPALWQNLYATTSVDGKALNHPIDQVTVSLPIKKVQDDFISTGTSAVVYWMKCPNDLCSQLLVLVGQSFHHLSIQPEGRVFKYWFAIPPAPSPRQIDPLLKEPLRTDYIEASSILVISPRMSSVLSRSIVADLLKQHAGREEYNLASRIDAFLDDKNYPERIKENLHYLREIADFSAHTQKDQNTGKIIEVDREEAEWTLDVVDGLFDYFIVQPAKDLERRTKFEAKMAAAGRKPIKKRGIPKN
jgi:hypothetical protein